MAPRVLWYVQQHHLSSTREGGGNEEIKGEVPAVLRLLKVDLAKAEASNPYPDYQAASSSLPSLSSFSFSSPSSMRDAGTGGKADKAASVQHVIKAAGEGMEKEGGSEGGKLPSVIEAANMEGKEEMLECTNMVLIWRRVLFMLLGVCCCVGFLGCCLIVWS